MRKNHTIKQIFLTNESWWNFYNKQSERIRDSILIAVVKLLSCKNIIRGHQLYRCSNINCSHIKRVPHTCKSKACSSCGKKASEVWIRKQYQLLPQTSWQHITFTMPSQLWDFFWHNRDLLNLIGKIAAHCIKTQLKSKNITTGIFIAIHTFGRDLKRNVHVHLSVTNGGITKSGKWKSAFFRQNSLMKMWRYQIIKMFREAYKTGLSIPNSIRNSFNPTFTFQHFLGWLYKKTWIVHCAKPSNNYKHNIKYLGRYIKRPAIAESKLKHYDGHEVVFKYLDHKTKSYQQLTLTVEQFIARFIQHIPDVNFRMIRYYGFLANRVRGKLLPIVNLAIGKKNTFANTSATYAQLIQENFHFDPLLCILCGSKLQLAEVSYGRSQLWQLLKFHRELATMKNC